MFEIIAAISISIILMVIFVLIALKLKDKIAKKEIDEAGRQGEIIVSSRLNEIANKYGGYLFDDFIFRHKNNVNYSTEIDHILITQGGVFVIETKNNSGVILGKEIEEEWVCLKDGYKENKTFRNPIEQNKVHINCLNRMFDVKPPKMISMIIFVSADISQIESNLVFNLDNAIEVIENLTRQSQYSQDFVERIYGQISTIKNNYSISKDEHKKNIKRSHGS